MSRDFCPCTTSNTQKKENSIVHAYTYTYLYILIHTYTRLYTPTHTYTRLYTYTHTYTHLYTLTYYFNNSISLTCTSYTKSNTSEAFAGGSSISIVPSTASSISSNRFFKESWFSTTCTPYTRRKIKDKRCMYVCMYVMHLCI